jgi:hypothetical protein
VEISKQLPVPIGINHTILIVINPSGQSHYLLTFANSFGHRLLHRGQVYLQLIAGINPSHRYCLIECGASERALLSRPEQRRIS